MQKLTLREVNPNLKEFYSRAIDGSRRDDYDYAISLLKTIVQKAPGFGEARTKLREFELAKLEKDGGPGMNVALRNMLKAGKIRKLVDSDPLQAMAMCEEELGRCLNNPPILKLLVEAAEKAEARFISIEALEFLVRFNSRSQAAIEQLVEFYKEEERLDDIVKLYQSLALERPGELEIQQKLREATQAAGREKGRRSSEAERESVTLQLEEGIIRDATQARIVIDKYNKMLAEADSIDIRRKLASAYMVSGDFDAAAHELETVAKMLGNSDPQLDKLIEKAYLAKFDHAINLLRSNPQAYENSEEQLAGFLRSRDAFRLERAKKRLEAYPKDAQLQVDLGHLYYELQDFPAAIAAFEQAQENHQRRAVARVGIARCKMMQRQYDEAIPFFVNGLSEMIKADRIKLEALYDLAQTYEQAGQLSKAVETFQEIMQNNVKFKDVKQQIARLTNN